MFCTARHVPRGGTEMRSVRAAIGGAALASSSQNCRVVITGQERRTCSSAVGGGSDAGTPEWENRPPGTDDAVCRRHTPAERNPVSGEPRQVLGHEVGPHVLDVRLGNAPGHWPGHATVAD